MNNQLKTTVAWVVAVFFFCSCGRFGKPIERTPDGKVSPIVIPVRSDAEVENIYHAVPLHRSLVERPDVARKWDKLRVSLSGSGTEKREKRRRIGRLLGIALLDQTELRVPLVQLWAIRYGQHLNANEGARAEQVMTDQVLCRTDFENFSWFSVLATLVSRPGDVSAERMASLDKFFRTGVLPQER